MKVDSGSGLLNREGRGLFASGLVDRFPNLPMEEEGRLNNARFPENFVSQVFCYKRWMDLQLSPDYTHALVGDPTREYLWIVSRSPQMDDATYNRLVDEARMQGFDVSRLQKTRQSGS